jgi:hypothetical protein
VSPITQLVTFLPRFFIPAGPAVAGAETTAPPPVEEEKPAVLGSVSCQMCIWWPFLVLQALALLFHYLLTRQKSKKLFWRGGIIISVLIYLLFLFLNRDCKNGWALWLSTASFWCNFFILWVILIFSALSFIFRPKDQQSS